VGSGEKEWKGVEKYFLIQRVKGVGNSKRVGNFWVEWEGVRNPNLPTRKRYPTIDVKIRFEAHFFR